MDVKSNNPLRNTDPSGYFISGGWGYWDRKLKANTSALYGDRDSWNNHLDYIYGRGAFAAGGGFGGTTAFYGVGGSCLGIGSVGSGMLDDETYLTANGISFIERWTGKTPVNQFGQWGYYENVCWTEGTQFVHRDEQGYTQTIDMKTFAFREQFVAFEKRNSSNSNYSWVDFGLNSVSLMSHTIITRQLSDMALPALGSRYLNGLKTASTTLKIVGTTTSVISGFISIYRNIKNPNPTWGDNAQLAVGVTSSVLSVIPQTTYLGILIGMIDTFGGFNSWYSDWNQAQQTWNYYGFAFIPIINPSTGTYLFIAK